jgi:predicted deacylase
VTEAFKVGAAEVRAGSHEIVKLPVTTRLDGSELAITLHVAHGAASGPTLALVSTLHGNQWSAIEALRRVIVELDPAQLHGTLLVVPVGNPLAFEQQTRMTPDESDLPDLNRVFPGGETWIAEQIAGVISRHVVERADALLNYHTSPWGSTIATVDYIYELSDPAAEQRTAELAVAYGYPCIRAFNVFGSSPGAGPRSIGAHAITLGIPNIAPNIGGAGFSAAIEEEWVQANVSGIRNVMIQLGMLAGSIVLPPRFFACRSRGYRVVPKHGGLLEPVLGPEALLTEVTAGDLLGRVVSPYTFETIEELRAPVDGVIFGVARSHPVWPGDWGYFVADGTLPGNRWVASAASVAATVERIRAEA